MKISRIIQGLSEERLCKHDGGRRIIRADLMKKKSVEHCSVVPVAHLCTPFDVPKHTHIHFYFITLIKLVLSCHFFFNISYIPVRVRDLRSIMTSH